MAKLLKPGAKGAPRRSYRNGRTAERLGVIRELIGRGWPPSRIDEVLSEKWECDVRTVQSYRMAVRESTRRDLDEGGKDYLASIMLQLDAHYGICVKDKAHGAAVQNMKLRATLLGLDAPRKVEITGANGGPIENHVSVTGDMQTLSEEEMRVIAKMVGEPDEPAQH